MRNTAMPRPLRAASRATNIWWSRPAPAPGVRTTAAGRMKLRRPATPSVSRSDRRRANERAARAHPGPRRQNELQQEGFDEFGHNVKLVVVNPVAGVGNHLVTGVGQAAEEADARLRGPTLGAADEQDRTGDFGPNRPNVLAGELGRGVQVHVAVELPAVRTILVLIGAMDGEVPRLIRGEMGIGLLHPLERFLHRAIASRHAARHLPSTLDPVG